MRWCSSWLGSGGSSDGIASRRGGSGSDPGGAPTDSSAELHPASTSASAAANRALQPEASGRVPPGRGSRCARANVHACLSVPSTVAGLRVWSVSIGELDLLRVVGLDSRSVAILDPSAHPHAAVFQHFRHYAGGREGALMAF
jgi:hypothetical protein